MFQTFPSRSKANYRRDKEEDVGNEDWEDNAMERADQCEQAAKAARVKRKGFKKGPFSQS